MKMTEEASAMVWPGNKRKRQQQLQQAKKKKKNKQPPSCPTSGGRLPGMSCQSTVARG